MTSISNPRFTFLNKTERPVIIYQLLDSGNRSQSRCYFGPLTRVGTVVAPGREMSIQRHDIPVSTYIVYDIKLNPVKWITAVGDSQQTFEITLDDVAIMAATKGFVALLTTDPVSALAIRFQQLMKDGKAKPSEIDAFFRGTAAYRYCTYISYLLVVVALARKPDSGALALAKKTYSLSLLCKYLGISWSSELTDITVTGFSCTDADDVITLRCLVDGSTVNLTNDLLIYAGVVTATGDAETHVASEPQRINPVLEQVRWYSANIARHALDLLGGIFSDAGRSIRRALS
jgi:hypothetical protein